MWNYRKLTFRCSQNFIVITTTIHLHIIWGSFCCNGRTKYMQLPQKLYSCKVENVYFLVRNRSKLLSLALVCKTTKVLVVFMSLCSGPLCRQSPDSHWMPTQEKVASGCKLIIHNFLTAKSLPLTFCCFKNIIISWNIINISILSIFYYFFFLTRSNHVPQTSLFAYGR